MRPGAENALTTLVVTRPSAVIFTLPASNLDDVRAAMARGVVEVTAYDQDNLRELAKGRLLLIDNSVDPATATIRLKAMFANADDRLWPGQFVNARVLIDTRRDVVTIFSGLELVPPSLVDVHAWPNRNAPRTGAKAALRVLAGVAKI